MVLFITDNEAIQGDLDMVVMDSKEFNFIEAHPYIASANFKNVYLDLACNAKPTYVEMLSKKTVITPVTNGEITQKMINLLMYIYPTDGAALRYYFIKDKDKLNSLLVELSKKYNWRSIDEF